MYRIARACVNALAAPGRFPQESERIDLSNLIHLRREARVMRRLFAMFFGFGLGLAAMFMAFEIHVVKTDTDWHFVRKQETKIADFYVDIRKWDRDEWARHPDFQKSLVEAGKTELLPTPQPEDILNDAMRHWDTARRVLEAARQ